MKTLKKLGIATAVASVLGSVAIAVNYLNDSANKTQSELAENSQLVNQCMQIAAGEDGILQPTEGVALARSLGYKEAVLSNEDNFEGQPPNLGAGAFDFTYATVYYLPGTTNWGTTFGGRPTMLWNPHLTNDANFGIQANQFGFTLAGTSNLTVVVEACTNLASPVWCPIATNTLTTGSSYFADPLWATYPERFYRIHSPFSQ